MPMVRRNQATAWFNPTTSNQMTKQNLWLTASMATMAAGCVALGIGLNQMSTTGKGSELFLAGFIGTHLAVLPLKAAEHC